MIRRAEDVADPTVEAMAARALGWLAGCQVTEAGYDQGGIFDPLDGRVVGDHYGATHFAWACALGYARTREPALLQAAKGAVAFHLRTSVDEYPPGTWDYHWDFNNLAFAETCRLLEPQLEPQERADWQTGLAAWKTNPHWAVNWVSMRAAAHFLRHDLLGRPEDLTLAGQWLDYVLASQLPDGGIEDVRGHSLPSQYHAYSACLLHRMRLRHPSVDRAVVAAARWLLAVAAPDGEVNALGRGQGQIFGYACAVYLFRAAATLDAELAHNHRWAARAVCRRLERFQTVDGWWPLVLNDLPVQRRAGWYDYHHQSVYNAFAALWLTLAARLPVPEGEATPPAPGERWLRQSGILAVRRQRYFAVFCAGREGAGYSTEAGITPHDLTFGERVFFRGPLGPGTGKYGSRAAGLDQETHCLAPLWRRPGEKWQAPGGVEGSLAPGKRPGHWLLGLEAAGARWQRELTFGERFIEARDRLELSPNVTSRADVEVRCHNVPLAAAGAWETGPAFVRDCAGGPVLRVWGGDGLARAGRVEAASGEAFVLAAGGAPGQDVGWRLRQGAVASGGGRLPGIVCLSADPWSGLWKRKQRLLFELSRLGRSPRTLYVEPAVTLTEVVENPRRLVRSDGERPRRALGRRAVDMGHGFGLATPCLPWPGQRTFPGLARANRQSWLRQLHRLVDRAGFPEGYVLWLYHPSQIDVLDVLGGKAELVVYDWTDDWVAALPADRSDAERRALADRQEELLRRCDVVFAVSRTLHDRARAGCPDVFLLPNATDPEVFKPTEPGTPPHPLTAKRPVLVYLSQITERLDVALLAEVALARPDWTIVLAGPVVCQASLLDPVCGLDNVILAGALPYAEAAALTAQADVCLLPHRADALTRTLDPIKLYDYLATGRPIVSTDVAMHPELAAHVRVAESGPAFVAAVEAALAEAPQACDRRRQTAVAHTWPIRAAEAAAVLERYFPQG